MCLMFEIKKMEVLPCEFLTEDEYNDFLDALNDKIFVAHGHFIDSNCEIPKITTNKKVFRKLMLKI